MTPNAKHLPALLDRVAASFGQGTVVAPTALLVEELGAIRRTVPSEKWLKELVPACQCHPLHRLLLQDPYTRRAFEKPRGYAGDAEMLDFVYRGIPPEGTTGLGRQLFQVTTRSPNGLSVLARRDLIAAKIDAAARRGTPAILSVGCGHLREAQQARSIRPGWNGTFHAIDQDERSVAVVEQELSSFGVQAVCCSIGPLIRGERRLAGLTLSYASGLYDYLSDRLAIRLTRTLFTMLNPGGRLLIANFAPDSHGRGYMEAVMDWKLLYRDEEEMATLADAVPNNQIAERSVYRDPCRNIVFLELVRHG
jgi:hypothetical protein